MTTSALILSLLVTVASAESDSLAGHGDQVDHEHHEHYLQEPDDDVPTQLLTVTYGQLGGDQYTGGEACWLAEQERVGDCLLSVAVEHVDADRAEDGDEDQNPLHPAEQLYEPVSRPE